MLTYLDNNATTRPAPEVVAAMTDVLTHGWGNPSSVHRVGQDARRRVDAARSQLAALVNVGESELLLTGGGTEATNLALRSLVLVRAPRRAVVTSTVEHSATRETLAALKAAGSVDVIEVPVDGDGQLDFDAYAAALARDDVACATMLWANNETGVLFDAAALCSAAKARGVPLHLDATQAVGKVPVDFRAHGVDLATFAPHKFHGPKGVGVLYARRGVRLRPQITGGPQERGRRGGTENTAGIVGGGVAAELALKHLADVPRVEALRDRMERAIVERIPRAAVNGARAPRLPNTTNVGFAALSAEAILIALSEQGVCASAGAACSSGSLEPSHVLRAMNVDEKFAFGSVRFSLARDNTDADVDRLLQVLPRVIERLRAVMPI